MSIIAIKNAKVYDSLTGQFPIRSLLIKNKLIRAILPNNELPGDITIIDGTNLYVTPGLIDTCSQIGLKEIGIRWEGNDSCEPLEKNAYRLQVVDGIYPFDQAFRDAISSGVTTAHILSSPEDVVGANTAIIHTNGKTVDEMILNKNFGYSFSMGDIPKNAFWQKTKTPLTRMGIAQQIRKTLSQLQQEKVLSNIPVFIRCHRADDIASALRIAEEYSIKPVLVHATEYNNVMEISSNHPPIIAGPCFQPIERNELRKLSTELYHDLFKKNVLLTFATDHPTSTVSHLHLEGCLAVKAGACEKDVLNGLTINAAKLLQIDHLTGNINEGLYADLVCWNKHPLSLTAKPVRTFIKGKEVYKEEEIHA